MAAAEALALLVLVLAALLLWTASHFVRHGSLFVPDDSGQPWPGDIPLVRGLDVLKRPGCFRQLLLAPEARSLEAGWGLCESSLGLGGAAAWLDTRGPFVVQGGFAQWTRRWSRALHLLAELAGDMPVALSPRPIEQSSASAPVYMASLSAYVRALLELGPSARPGKPLYWAEATLAAWRREPDGKSSIECAFLSESRRSRGCRRLVEFLFQDFGWVGSVLGQGVREIETSVWIGPAGARTGLHADIEPFNLLVVMKGRKRVTLWPPRTRARIYPSGRFDASASLSDVDVFDPDVDEKWPLFSMPRRANYTLELSEGDVLHIPAGWWHVVENLEMSVALTFHVWKWDWSETIRWAPHEVLDILHDRGWYRNGWCTCHRPQVEIDVPLLEFMEAPLLDDSTGGCSSSSVNSSSVSTAEQAKPPGRASAELAEWTLLFSGRSDFQTLAVWQNSIEDSRYLVLDGDVQLTSRGEFVYHEMLAYVPLSSALCSWAERNCSARDACETVSALADIPSLRVFVFGAGDGGIVERLLRHPGVAHVLQVEIDGLVVDVSQRFFPELQRPESAAHRHKLVVGDGVSFARRAASGDLAGAFDLVIMDTTDALLGDGEGRAKLFTAQLYRDLSAMLGPGGVLAQNVQSFDHLSGIVELKGTMEEAFDEVVPYQFATPDYTSPFFAFLALKPLEPGLSAPCPQSQRCARRMLLGGAADGPPGASPGAGALAGPPPRYYSQEVHEAAFVLPAALADLQVVPRLGCPSRGD